MMGDVEVLILKASCHVPSEPRAAAHPQDSPKLPVTPQLLSD